MVIALVILSVFILAAWLIFFKLKLIQFGIAWGVVSFLMTAHVLLVFLIGLRFMTPYSTDVRVIQHTIQLIPRLPEPTLVTAVLVEPDETVQKGQPLFQFDRRPYEYKVRQLEADLNAARERVVSHASKIERRQAELVAANQDVLMLKEDEQATDAKVQKIKSDLTYVQLQHQRYAARGPGRGHNRRSREVVCSVEGGGGQSQGSRCRGRTRALEIRIANQWCEHDCDQCGCRAHGGAGRTQRSASGHSPGAVDMLSVLQLQTDQIASEAEILKSKYAQLANRINLHLALGGSFDSVPAATPPNTVPVSFQWP